MTGNLEPVKAWEARGAAGTATDSPRKSRPRGRPTSEDAARIDDELLSAALEAFSREGYGGASMRSIAKAAGVARTTLQARYETKQALFQAIMTQQIARMAAATSLSSDGPPDLRAGLRAYANRALSFSLEGEFLAVNRLVYGAANQFPEVGEAAMESTRMGIIQIRQFIEKCAEADGIPCQNPAWPAECFILLLRGWYGHAFLRPDPVTVEERQAWIDRMVDTLIAGRSGW